MLVSNPGAMRSSNLLGLCTFQEPWAEAYYQRKRKEGKTHNMAVRALSNVWVRIIYGPLVQARALPDSNLPRCTAGL